MKFTKLFALLMALLMVMGVFASCSNKDDDVSETTADPAGDTTEVIKDETTVPTGDTTEVIKDETTVPTEDNVTVRIAGLKGPTSMGLAKLMEDNAEGKSANKYEFSVFGSAAEVTPKLVKGEFDIAALPANLGSVLFNNTKGKIQVLAINTLGVLYIVDKGETIKSVADLKGKTIYATGKGATPEYTLRYILSQNGIDPDKDVTLEFKSEPTEVVGLLNSSESGIAMLPQPFVTVALGKVKGLEVSLDMTEEWDKLHTGSALLTGTIVVRKEFAEQHPEVIAKFLAEYKASTEFVNANVEKAAELIEKFGIFQAAVAKVAIPKCHITYIDGTEMQKLLNDYLKVMYDQNPKSVGGTMPTDGFYYGIK